MQDYFVFDDIKSIDKNILLLDYRITFLPSNKRKFREIPGKNGSIPHGDWSKNDIIINCDVAILGEDETEVNNNIELATPWLNQRNKLKMWDMLDRYYIGEIVNESIMFKQLSWNEFTLQFRCDPIKFGDSISTQFVSGDTLINSGTYETTGIIEIALSDNINHVEITLQNNGEEIHIGHDFIAGDVVKIDLEKEKVYKNGFSIQEDVYLESDFFNIPLGNFIITSNLSETMNLQYIERWL